MFINGDCIQEYRLENDISLEEMADILSIDAETLIRYENGTEPWYEEDALLIAIVDSLFEDLDYVFSDDGQF